MNWRWVLIVGCVWGCAGSFGEVPGAGRRVAGEEEVGKTLDGRMDVKWEGVTVEAALGSLRNKNVSVDLEGIKKGDADWETKISLTARQVTLGELLGLISDEAGLFGDAELAWHVAGGNVVVSSMGEEHKRLVKTSYEVSDLMKMGGKGIAAVGSGRDAVARRKAEVESARLLMNLVARMVESERWVMVGGEAWPGAGGDPFGRMGYEGGKIGVASTGKIQGEVAAFLAMLRKGNEAGVEGSEKGVEAAATRGAATAAEARIGSLRWEGVRLDEALAELGTKLGMGVIVDWKVIENENIPRDTKISLTARNVTIGQALALISRDMQAGSKDGAGSRLAYQVVGGNIRVTTEAMLNRRGKQLRAYEIGDLVKATGADRRNLSEGAAAMMVMRSVAGAVDRESWMDVGDQAWWDAGADAFGTISYFDGLMVVGSSAANQKRVDAFLVEQRKNLRLRQIVAGAEVPEKVTVATTTPAATETIAEVKWEKTTLEKALKDLSAKGGVNIIVKWRIVQEANIPPSMIIDLTAKNVTFNEALSLLLTEASAGQQTPLDYYVVGANIVVTTTEDIHRRGVMIRAYEVGDLLRVADKGDGAMGVEGPRRVLPRNAEEENRVRFGLMGTVAGAVDRESWAVVGGLAWAGAGGAAFGAMDVYNGKLIVLSTAEDQKGVEAFLALLRKR